MSDSSRVAIRAMPETTWGVIPSAALQNVRFTGESLKYAIANIVSEEIRSDRQITDLIQTSKEGNGGIDFEMSYDNLDWAFPGIMMAAWAAELTVTDTDISAAASDNSLNSAGAGFPAFTAGMWIKVAGFTGSAANNGYFRVVSRTTSKIVVSGGTLVDDAAAESVTVNTIGIRNGVTEKSFVLEKEFTDVASSNFHVFTGAEVQNFNLALSQGAIATGGLTFLAKDMAVQSSSAGTGAATAAPTGTVMNAMTNVAQILEGGAALTTGVFVRELSLALTNNLRGRPAIGVVGHSSLGQGRVQVTGNAVKYFEEGSVYQKYVDGTASSISFRMTDAAGNTYVFDLPNIKYTDGDVLAGSADSDVLVSVPFQALMDPTNSYTIQVSKFS